MCPWTCLVDAVLLNEIVSKKLNDDTCHFDSSVIYRWNVHNQISFNTMQWHCSISLHYSIGRVRLEVLGLNESKCGLNIR